MQPFWFRRFRLLAVIGFTAALILSHASLTHAQIDQARKGEFEKASDLIPRIVDATNQGKRSDANTLLDDFIANMNTVADKLGRTGDRLHENDKRWLATTPLSQAMTRLSVVKNHAVRVKQALAKLEENPSSTLSDFKSAWEDSSVPLTKSGKHTKVVRKRSRRCIRSFKTIAGNAFEALGAVTT